MSLKDLIVRAKAERDAKLAERNSIAEDLNVLRGMDEVDESAVSEKRAAKNAADAELDALIERVAELEAEDARDEAVNRLQAVSTPSVRKPAYDAVTRTGAEPRTYSPDTDRTGAQFLSDVVSTTLNGSDFDARNRMERHMAEERVERGELLNRGAAAVANFAGLVVPQYLTDLVAKNAKAGRPLADAMRHLDLPAVGNTVNISRVTTGTSAAVQTENTAPTESSIDDTLLSPAVVTVENWQSLSRQSIDRSVGALDVTVDDLIRGYHTKLDDTLINAATNGLTNVATSITYTDSSPTAAELYPKVLQGISAIEAVLLDQSQSGNIALMHSRRWYWMQSQVGTSFPFMGQPGLATQTGGVNYGELYGAGFRGLLPDGTPVVVDNNIGTTYGAATNEDEIYIINVNEAFLWEDPSAPMFIRADAAGATSLNVPLVVFGYMAYTFARYTGATQKIGGTGLVVPTW